jgi:maleylacetate reductase
MDPFIYTARPGRIIFGAGAIQHLAREIGLLGAKRAIVLCTPEQRAQAQAVVDQLGSAAVGIFDRATMHVPMEIAKEALERARQLSADCAIAIGGGSTIGLGKAIALQSSTEHPMPIVAIPTTYAGSEVTPIFGVTEGGLKRTGTDLRVLPRTVIYDSQLTLSLPVSMSITSGLNAMAHAAEGLYAQDRSPIMSLMAQEGIRALASALPVIARAPADLNARDEAQYGAWLCGTVLGSTGMALHHKLCHTLGGSFNLPHAETHTVVLPHALAYNEVAAPEAMRQIASALGRNFAPQGIHALAQECGAPVSLQALGMREEDLDRAADIACANPYWNPRPLDREGIRALLQDAFDGVSPRSGSV